MLGGATLGMGLTLFESEGVPAGAAPGRTPTAGPGAFTGTIVAKQVKFVQRQFTLPPNSEVTLVMDNQDLGIAHNIAFYVTSTPGEGAFLDGCTSGCDPAPQLRTPIQLGRVKQTFTFQTPGARHLWLSLRSASGADERRHGDRGRCNCSGRHTLTVRSGGTGAVAFASVTSAPGRSCWHPARSTTHPRWERPPATMNWSQPSAFRMSAR